MSRCLLGFISVLLVCANAMAHEVSEFPEVASLDYGSKVYAQRCVLCHGRNADGKGKMARVIKDPAPFDLTASRLPDDYLRQIIEEGSEALGRSKHMPPWRDALQKVEIDSVVLYVKSVRD